MIGVVADDITGANDIGIMFAKSDIVTHVYSYEEYDAGQAQEEEPEVVILDTNSRLDDAKTAYDKVYQATIRLREAGAALYINKTCSVFRGNIGPEFDAMLDALNESFAVVVLGFPKNGRTTVDGIHYVHGKRLEDSEFRNDPVHPMTESSLVDILRAQTNRKVDSIDYRTVEQGPEALREKLREKRKACNYCIIDVTDQSALRTIARAVKNDFLLFGSSALAEELAQVLDMPRDMEGKLHIPLLQGCGILCAAGSLMPQTAAQIDYMRKKGVVAFEMNSLALLDNDTRQDEVARLTEEAGAKLAQGRNVVLHSTNDKAKVEETKRLGAAKGLANTEISRIVSDSLADITARLVERTGQNRLVIAGGETSAAVCERLGVRGLRVWKEIQAGLPSCVTLTMRPMLLVLKSGSFGNESFFEAAIEHLLRQ